MKYEERRSQEYIDRIMELLIKDTSWIRDCKKCKYEDEHHQHLQLMARKVLANARFEHSKENIDKLLGGEWKYEENTGDSNGVGMDNVIARLKLFNDSDDVIRIKSEGKDMGTEVVICLPFENDKE